MDLKEQIRDTLKKYYEKPGWESLPVKLYINPETMKKIPVFPKHHDGSTVSWAKEKFTKETALALVDTIGTNGIAIKTGRDSNLFVLDCDQPLELAQKYLADNKIVIPDDALTIQTQSGGLQYYFKFDSDLEKITSTGAKVFGEHSPVDIRGNRGLVFAPPSVVRGGGKYSFKNMGKLRSLPDELMAFLLKRASPGAAKLNDSIGSKATGNVQSGQQENHINDLSPKQLAILKKAEERAREAKVGERSEAEFGFFCTSIQMGMSKEVIWGIASTFGKTREQGSQYFEHTYMKAMQRVKAAQDNKPACFSTLANAETDGDIGRIVLSKYAPTTRHCYSQKTTFTFTGSLWVPNPEIPIQRVKGLRDDIEKARLYAEQHTFDADEKKAIQNHLDGLVKRVDNTQGVKNILVAIQSEPGVPIKIDDFDKDAMKLNCLNGTLNLKTGELLPFNANDFITKAANVSYDPAATCPQWVAFLNRIMSEDQEMIQYLQRATGYSLTGNTSERCFFILYGTGANGKSVFIEVQLYMFGDYGAKTPADTICKKQAGVIPNDIAALKGVRFACASETEQNARLNEAKIKEMAGGSDSLVGCFKFKEPFSYKPEFKLWLATNHRPKIHETDPAIWDRIQLIPFAVRIPAEERDKQLLDKLQVEAPGILNWALEGLKAWQKSGLQPPEKVLASTAQYKNEEDIFGLFIGDCCFVGEQYQCSLEDIYSTYVEWAEKNSYHPFSKLSFSNIMTERNFPSGHDRKGATKTGIAIRTQAEPEIDYSQLGV